MTTENTLYNNGSATASIRMANLPPTLNKCLSIALVCMFMTLSAPTYAATSLKAFACAQGFGAIASGGRGGDIYHVTKLSDDGSVGTLRYGLDKANGPRTIVFDLGGIIHLNKILYVRNNNITIAGQTAPGGGITLAGYKTDIRGSNVVIRYIRFRVGDYNVLNPSGRGGNGNADLKGTAADALQVYRADRIMLDHISVSWSIDENLAILFSTNVTLQHSIISEGLYDSLHPKGVHSMGLMLRGEASGANGKGGYTIYQNLLAHNNMRNPIVGGADDYLGLDFTNNVIYNWGTYSGHTGQPKAKLNYVNNYLIAGPSTGPKQLHTAMREQDGIDGKFYIYLTGNYMDTDKDGTHDGKPVGSEAFVRFEPGELLANAFPFPLIENVISAEAAYQNIITNAGASLVRDTIDRRIINDVQKRDGDLIDTQEEVGGLSTIAKGTAPIDIDRDGMPDNWESANGLDPTNANDRNRTDLSAAGYTNLEVYLDSIVASAGHCEVGGNKVQPPVNQDDNVSDNSSEPTNNEPNLGSTSLSIWNDSDVPGNPSENDSGAVELGVKFMSDEDGFIEGIRFYKGPGNTGSHLGNLWTSTGQLLASATFTNETASGWQQVKFAKPVSINKDTVYVASYYAPNGHYAFNNYAFSRSSIDNTPLHLLQSGVHGNNGVYAYGSSSSFPNSHWLHTNYWVDVLFSN